MKVKNRTQAALFMLFIAVMLVLSPLYTLTSYAATARIAFSDPSATVGSQVNVTMKVTSSDNLASVNIMLSYDSTALEFVEGTNAEGDAGAIRVRGDAGTPNTGTLAYYLTFNVLKAGTSKITVTSQEVYDSSSQLVTVDKQGDSTITASSQGSSTSGSDASLASLTISPGTLTPEFSPDVDSYEVTVGTDVEKLILHAECTDENASVVVSGNENLQMGENRVSLRVTAADSETSREYIIVVTKAEGGASASETTESFQMPISRRVFTVLEPDDSVEIPEGFKERAIKINGHQVTGWVWASDTDPEYCVIYAMNEAGETNFYRYDMKDTEHTLQRYFEDPAISGAVSEDVYNQLALNYEELAGDFNLFKILLVVAILIAFVLLVLLIVTVLGKGRKGGQGQRESRRKDGFIVANRGDGRDADDVRREAYERGEEEGYDEDEEYEDEEYEDEEDAEEDGIDEEEGDSGEEAEDDYVVEADEEEEPEPVYVKKEAQKRSARTGTSPAGNAGRRPVQAKKAPAEKQDEDDDFEIFDL